FRAKRIALHHAGLYSTIFLMAFQHRRHLLFLAIVSIPLFIGVWQKIKQEWPAQFTPPPWLDNYRRGKKIFTIIFLLLLIALSGRGIMHHPDIWNETRLLAQNDLPYGALRFLQNQQPRLPLYIFNEFRWGGYFNWELPEAFVFLDGRGTATWRTADNKYALEKYREIKFSPGSLRFVEQSPAQYILLEARLYDETAPEAIDNLIFSAADLAFTRRVASSTLEDDLRKSPRWHLVYRDAISQIWQRVKRPKNP
ncbi:MAG: hypothetical protein HY984_00765, partial [Candidatus Magasanikbacteria bacterium]|nr:hypothetical protein [Candidatus Magasanikbacteria bacterium]